ncbi:MAG: VOC family protein [Acidimicrobiales bacterium]|nr:VOC family protein [Acidimicrobiales bacterium]
MTQDLASTGLNLSEVPVSRLQLALNVTDLEESIAFYSKLFATPPAKVREGYANWEIAEPPLKLVIFEATEGGTLNHLGVETESAEEVVAAESRLAAEGLATTGIDDTICCFASKVETWVTDPDGARWEWYVKTGDADTIGGDASDDEAVCCAPSAETVVLGRRADAG